MEVVALHDASEAAALGRADDVHDFSLGEHAGVDTRPDLQVLEAVSGNFAQRLHAVVVVETRLPQVAFNWLVRPRPLAEAKLHGRVAVTFGRSKLGDEAWPSLHEGGGGDHAVFVEQPGHPQLSTEQSLDHR